MKMAEEPPGLGILCLTSPFAGVAPSLTQLDACRIASCHLASCRTVQAVPC